MLAGTMMEWDIEMVDPMGCAPMSARLRVSDNNCYTTGPFERPHLLRIVRIEPTVPLLAGTRPVYGNLSLGDIESNDSSDARRK